MNILIESIGYIGSALVVVSMLMTSVKKLRLVNTIGSTIFTVYALIIHSYPTALMNTCLVIINIINIVKLFKAEKTFSVIECFKDESIVQLYLRSNLSDINKYFPDFSPDNMERRNAYMVFTGSAPIGILIGSMNEDNSLTIELDYTIPSYRDYSVANYLHKYMAEKHNVKTLIFEGKMTESDTYLEKMKFEKTNGVYQKSI